MQRPNSQRADARLAFTLLVALALWGGVACVRAPEVPREDVRATEETLLLESVRGALEAQGYDVVAEAREGRYVETNWVGDERQRRRVSVRVSHTSMGMALATKVQIATPAAAPDPSAAPEAASEGGDIVLIEGNTWRVASARDAAAKAEEQRVGQAIEALWRERRRELRTDE